MNWYDDGDYIRYEDGYLNLFKNAEYDFQVLKRFKKCFVYNELFFHAAPKSKSSPSFSRFASADEDEMAITGNTIYGLGPD